ASAIVTVKHIDEGVALVNEFAPEHLEILTEEPFKMLNAIRNAGAIFLGAHTPEPVGDYFAGPNHTIPTGGRARFSSPLGVADFVKRSSIISYSAERLKREGEAIRKFAEREQLFAHGEAIRVRTGGGGPAQPDE
ncbi:MAG: histidinol dehydrogenase, partial [bacterium]